MSNKTRNSTTLAESGKDTTWPESLENFVKESFRRSQALLEGKKVAFQKQIRRLLEKAEKEDKLFINNWLAQKIPVLDNVNHLELFCDIQNSSATTPQDVHKPTKRLAKYDSEEKKRMRSERFNSPTPAKSATVEPVSIDGRFVGRCQNLEKLYYRLTSAPDPKLVRPQNVLETALKRILTLIDEKPYSYIKDQFKAMRQDLTVQHIKNDFSLHLYSTNARIAIRNNDLGEMNQCLTQIEYLFAGDLRFTQNGRQQLEFLCYRILYLMMVGNHSEVFRIKYRTMNRQYREPEKQMLQMVQLAFEFHKLATQSNYIKYFTIMEKFKDLELADKLIQDYLIEKERIKTLDILAKAYRQLSIEFIAGIFRMESENLVAFLNHFGLESTPVIECAVLRPQIQGLMSRTNFKKIDIKGQI